MRDSLATAMKIQDFMRFSDITMVLRDGNFVLQKLGQRGPRAMAARRGLTKKFLTSRMEDSLGDEVAGLFKRFDHNTSKMNGS